MSTIDITRNKIIDKLLVISNERYLDAILQIVDNSSSIVEKVKLHPAQIELLRMSEDDYKNGRVISQEQLDKEDKEWLALK
ncbi:MAG: hypothetical protein IPO14_05550 [Saprospiraceae bacterium]|jgi:hypothetical protein|nr:hypothetical protein [Saprospiraceae bacterium]